jgi:osmotically-inducible protein OsmY
MNRTTILLQVSALLLPCGLLAQEGSPFHAYIDSDLCARLMLGPITESRVACSKSTYKDGAEPVVVQLRNNMVLSVNKQKVIGPLVGQLADVTGDVNAKNGTMKIQAATPITEAAIPAGDPGRKLLDVRMYKADKNAQVYEKVRHELAMMPYISNFDFISFTMNGSTVILTGWTVRQTNRSTAQNVVKDVEGVDAVVNNIDILPLGQMDMQIRAAVRLKLQRVLARYFWGNGSDIKIIVKSGQVILLGVVATKEDSDLAFIQTNGTAGVFKVFNMLQVRGPAKG